MCTFKLYFGKLRIADGVSCPPKFPMCWGQIRDGSMNVFAGVSRLLHLFLLLQAAVVFSCCQGYCCFARWHRSDRSISYLKLPKPLHTSLPFKLMATKKARYLHSQNPTIVHRDLKSLNVVLDLSLNIKAGMQYGNLCGALDSSVEENACPSRPFVCQQASQHDE